MKNSTEPKKPVKRSTKDNITVNIEEASTQPEPKKRGRKPKGGKLIVKDNLEQAVEPPPANVILHLKCSLNDIESSYETDATSKIKNPLTYDSSVPPSIMSYDSLNTDTRFARFLGEDHTKIADAKTAYNEHQLDINPSNLLSDNNILCTKCKTDIHSEIRSDVNSNNDVNMKDINDKLKRLKVNLYRNTMDEKQSACFWCTYEFDNQPCYIPKYESDGKIYGYGSFCRPECAVGHLMKESIDDSTKFERYHLLNRVYGKIYDYKNNIKPAPDPYYMLDKFYGNLSIQEYRKLLNSERMLLVIDSPLTRILPELHEDTDDFIAGVYGGDKGSATQAGGVYKVKRQSEKQPGVSKATIMKEKFGFSA